MNWTLISATNNDVVLKSCLLSSPDFGSAAQFIRQTGYTSAATAYNAAIQQANTELLVFAHQDVYFPPGWFGAVEAALEKLSMEDPNWGVLGVWGIDKDGHGTGNVYCAGLMERLGGSFSSPREVRSLDEIVLIIRRSSGLRFDDALPGFHFYGTDICLEAWRRGMKSYAISAFCLHNTNGYRLLPWQFWRCHLFMRRKWRKQLPIVTSCAEITFWCWPMLRWNLLRMASLLRKRHQAGKRVQNPAELFQGLAS